MSEKVTLEYLEAGKPVKWKDSIHKLIFIRESLRFPGKMICEWDDDDKDATPSYFDLSELQPAPPGPREIWVAIATEDSVVKSGEGYSFVSENDAIEFVHRRYTKYVISKFREVIE